MINPATIKQGDTLVYNDGRAGHENVKCVVLEVNTQAEVMTVQFEDRARTTGIRFTDTAWLPHLSVWDGLAVMAQAEKLLNAHPGVVASVEHPGFLDVQYQGKLWAFGDGDYCWMGNQTDLQGAVVDGTEVQDESLPNTCTNIPAIAAFILRSIGAGSQRWAIQSNDGRFVTQNGTTPALTANTHLAYVWHTSEEAKARLGAYLAALKHTGILALAVVPLR